MDLIPAEKHLCVALVDQTVADSGLDTAASLDVRGFDERNKEHFYIRIAPRA